MNKKQLKEKWDKMTEKQKAEWNGFDGFVKGKHFSKTSLFLKRGKTWQKTNSKN